MICNSCGKKITDNNVSICPYCNANLDEKDQVQEATIDVDAKLIPNEHSSKQDRDSDHIITPEVVNSGTYNSSNFKNNSKSGYERFVYTSHHGRGVNNLFFENGCFSVLLTLVLAISCVIQFGILAGIGFLVFSGIGSIFTFFLRVKSIMANRMFNPWFARVISWACAYMLIIWLSD